MFTSSEDFKVISEREQEDGSLLIEYVVSDKLLILLENKYGDNWPREFEKAIIDKLSKLINNEEGLL